jgi:hypothetical protein
VRSAISEQSALNAADAVGGRALFEPWERACRALCDEEGGEVGGVEGAHLYTTQATRHSEKRARVHRRARALCVSRGETHEHKEPAAHGSAIRQKSTMYGQSECVHSVTPGTGPDEAELSDTAAGTDRGMHDAASQQARQA